MRKIYLTAAVPALIWAVAASAQDAGTPGSTATTGTPASTQPGAGVPAPGTTGTPGQNATLSSLDTDRDGSISMQEATRSQPLSSQFLTLDRNGNGALEPAEFARFEAAGVPAPGSTSATPPNSTSATPGVNGTTSGTSRTGTTGTMSPAPGSDTSTTAPGTSQSPPPSAPRQ